MKYYESTPYTTKDYTEYAKKPVYSYGTGDSHETQLRLSTNDAYYIYADHFRDPRPGHEGERIYPDRAYIAGSDREGYELYGMDFTDRNGKYCCTYVGSYDKIIEDNEHDTGRSRGKDLDEYGVPRTPSGGQERNGNDRNGGITR